MHATHTNEPKHYIIILVRYVHVVQYRAYLYNFRVPCVTTLDYGVEGLVRDVGHAVGRDILHEGMFLLSFQGQGLEVTLKGRDEFLVCSHSLFASDGGSTVQKTNVKGSTYCEFRIRT